MRKLILIFLAVSCTLKYPDRSPTSIVEVKTILPEQEFVFLIEFKNEPLEIEKKVLTGLIPKSKIELFDDYKNDYFKRLYRYSFVSNSPDEVLLKLNSIKFIKRIERVFLIEDLSIKPNPEAKPLTNDLFFNYLWGVKNSGQKVFKDLDDIHLETLNGQSGIDIDWNEKINERMKDEVIIAVLDSGVDYDHPDLKDNIIKNYAECPDGKVPFKPKEDKDGNGYIGDCIGWNFTGKDLAGDNRPLDDIGHGTHVSGIIAAITSNKIGVTGISNKLKILPVKVLKKEDSKAGGNVSSLSDRVAKGILFAIKRGAKVINLSLGWPTLLDTNYLRETFNLANQQNVTIVAASGNNNNNSPIFPCAYENVICVSSISVDGTVSNFSNYGGYVDILAPGDTILSTFPSIKTPEIFFAKGYEIKNGTSQASPYVAAAAGVLKSIYPGISENELAARLFLSSKTIPFKNEKYISGGLLQLGASIEIEEKPLIEPILKEINSIPLNLGEEKFILPIKIKNFWKETNEISVKITSLSENIELEKQDFHFDNMTSGEIETIPISGKIRSLDEDNNFDFELKITYEGIPHSFKQNVKIVNLPGNHTKIIPLEGLTENDLIKKDQFLFPKIKTVTDPLFYSKSPFYYTWEKKEKEAVLKIFGLSDGNFHPLNPISIPGGINILSVILLDANYDGKIDFFIRTISNIDEKQFIIFSYFDQEGNPLFGDKSHWYFTPESVVEDLNRINFLHFFPYNSETLGKVAIPVQLLNGTVPKLDQNPDPFEPKDTRKSAHIYYFPPKLENEKMVVGTRIVDNWKLLKFLRVKFDLAFNDSLFLLESIPQNFDDLKNGVSKFLITAGKNFFTKPYILKIKENFEVEIKGLENNELHFEGSYFFPITELGEKTVFRNGLSIYSVYNDVTLRSSGIEKDKLVYSSVYRQNRQADTLVGAMASYKKGNKSYSFFQTKGHLKVLIHEDGKEDVVLSRPIVRFSFIPGELFSETFYPITRGKFPALYVDTTQISRNDVFILTIDDQGRLSSPIRYNLRIPENCRSLNPSPFNGSFSFTLLCQDNPGEKSWSIRFMEIQ